MIDLQNNFIKISCITPTYNRAHLLPRAIESTINQTYQNWEMIIVDDGSEDNTEEVVREYMKIDERIRYFKNPGEGGNAARNYGIKQAKGAWIAFLDDDDENLPGRFQKQLNAANETGSNYISSWFYTSNTHNQKLKPPKREPLYGLGDGLPSRWLIKKQLLIQAGGFDEQQVAMQDNELSYRLGQLESYLVHKEFVTVIYNTTNSLSRGKEKPLRGKIQLLDKWGHVMPPFEYANWCYSIAKDYLKLKYYEKAKSFLIQSKQNDNHNYFKVLINLELLTIRLGLNHNKLIKKLLKIFLKIFLKMKSNYPMVIDHRIFPKYEK